MGKTINTSPIRAERELESGASGQSTADYSSVVKSPTGRVNVAWAGTSTKVLAVSWTLPEAAAKGRATTKNTEPTTVARKATGTHQGYVRDGGDVIIVARAADGDIAHGEHQGEKNNQNSCLHKMISIANYGIRLRLEG